MSARHSEGPAFSATSSNDNSRLGLRLGLGLGSVIWLRQYQGLFPATTMNDGFQNGGPFGIADPNPKFLSQLCQTVTKFQNSFTGELSRKFEKMWSLRSRHTTNVSLYYLINHRKLARLIYYHTTSVANSLHEFPVRYSLCVQEDNFCKLHKVNKNYEIVFTEEHKAFIKNHGDLRQFLRKERKRSALDKNNIRKFPIWLPYHFLKK